MVMNPQNRIRPTQIHRAAVRTRMIQAVKVLNRETQVVTILSIRERITQKILLQAVMIQAEMILVAAQTLEITKTIPEVRNLQRKEAAAKWQISFRMARYPSIRISSCP